MSIVSSLSEDAKDGILVPSTSLPGTPISISFQQCPAQLILGRGMKPLPPLSRAECLNTRFWSISDWNTFSKPPPQAKKGGNHSVLYTELADQQADDLRLCVYSLFKSLASTGQAPAQASELAYEAMAYIHSNLAAMFPPLLRCEGGRWKIDKLISQLYSNWWRDRGRKYVPSYGQDSSLPPKREASETPMPDTPAAKKQRPAPTLSTPHPRQKPSPLANLQGVRVTTAAQPSSILCTLVNGTVVFVLFYLWRHISYIYMVDWYWFYQTRPSFRVHHPDRHPHRRQRPQILGSRRLLRCSSPKVTSRRLAPARLCLHQFHIRLRHHHAKILDRFRA